MSPEFATRKQVKASLYHSCSHCKALSKNSSPLGRLEQPFPPCDSTIQDHNSFRSFGMLIGKTSYDLLYLLPKLRPVGKGIRTSTNKCLDRHRIFESLFRTKMFQDPRTSPLLFSSRCSCRPAEGDLCTCA